MSSLRLNLSGWCWELLSMGSDFRSCNRSPYLEVWFQCTEYQLRRQGNFRSQNWTLEQYFPLELSFLFYSSFKLMMTYKYIHWNGSFEWNRKIKIARWTEVPSRVFVMCQPYELSMTQCHLLSTFAKQLYCCKSDFDLCMIRPLDCKSPLPPIWWIAHVSHYKVINHNLSHLSANWGLNIRTGDDLERFQSEWFRDGWGSYQTIAPVSSGWSHNSTIFIGHPRHFTPVHRSSNNFLKHNSFGFFSQLLKYPGASNAQFYFFPFASNCAWTRFCHMLLENMKRDLRFHHPVAVEYVIAKGGFSIYMQPGHFAFMLTKPT